jgi:uncharacterized lipoprotein YbaY
MEHIINGEILFPEIIFSFSDASIFIRLDDVSRADASSHALSEKVLRGISINAEHPQTIAFQISVPALDERSRYSLTVLVDVDNDGAISPGDYITMESFPVTASTVRINVRVWPVK